MTAPRFRRMRNSALTRRLVRETQVGPADLCWPLFVAEHLDGREEISSMPGQFRHGLSSLLRACDEGVEAGLTSVILFGIPEKKDAEGSRAWAEDGIVQRSLRALKDRGFPLTLMSDVCLCGYTDHGHCGLVRGETILNDESLPLLARTARSHAEAGADIVAPSDMLDFRVGAIREALDEGGFQDTPILSYAVKYASAYYGPFRDAAQSSPSFGDRRSHQMDPANLREALREARQDIEEGADMLMVKPGLAYLDVVAALRREFDLPIACYSVSGELAMIEAAAERGWIDRKRVILETLTSMKRAGADLILSYHAREALDWLGEND
jgi:porphobilinogen synthase